MTAYNILVTGCGGDIGQSIGKILKSDQRFRLVTGADLSLEHAGRFIYDNCFCLPRCDNDRYLQQLEQLIRSNDIDIILPMSEAELRFFSGRGIHSTLFGCRLIMANLKSMEVGFDKYLTSRFLESAGMPFPQTSIAGELENPQLPVILKNRNGSGSKSLFLIDNTEDFAFYRKKFPSYIVQEYLPNGSEEYTCGVYRSSKKEIRTIIFRRQLMGGFTGSGSVVANTDIDRLLWKIAEQIDLLGSINVQLRLTDKGPVVFEINPRFSSTVMFRHMMGFTDVIWSIEDVFGLPVTEYTPPINGLKFYKGFTEYVE